MSTPKISLSGHAHSRTKLDTATHLGLDRAVTNPENWYMQSDEEVDLEKGNDAGVLRNPPQKSMSHRKRLASNDMVVRRTFFGTIYIHSKRFVAEHDRRASTEQGLPGVREEHESTYGFRPAEWLLAWNLNLGGEFMLKRSARGWKNSIRTFRAVSDDHDMFRFCREGKMDGVRTLLSKCDASPWDINTHGWTPLHIAAHECNFDLCKLLLQAGSDPDALTYDFPYGNYEVCSPLVAACTYQRHREVGHDQRVNVLRLLADETDKDFTVSDSQAWKMMLVLLERSRPSSGFTSTDAAAVQTLKQYQEELRHDWCQENAFWLLLFCCESVAAMEVLLKINPDVANATVDGSHTFNIFQAMHMLISCSHVQGGLTSDCSSWRLA